MFSAGTLVNVPHFRGKPLLVVGTEGANTRCLWNSENGEMGEVSIPTSLLHELTAAPTPAAKPNMGDSLPADWFRKNVNT
ncbi:MAG TPA: hypothetical protein VM510_10495 [Caulifigura sp.]|nr:hypothetical protein [Caulifigura sp.]